MAEGVDGMINECVSGVCGAIAEEFGEGYRIYTEMIPQGFTEPCFFVAVESEEITPIRGKRYDWRHNISVIYSPAHGDDEREDAQNKLFDLMDILEYIEVGGDKVRGDGIKGSIETDEQGAYASCDVTYKYVVYKRKADDTELMETLEQHF